MTTTMKKVTLAIGRRFTGEFATPAEAVAAFKKIRDDSNEGASTFPDGRVKIDGKAHRISYNGRLWAGTKYVPGAESIPV